MIGKLATVALISAGGYGVGTLLETDMPRPVKHHPEVVCDGRPSQKQDNSLPWRDIGLVVGFVAGSVLAIRYESDTYGEYYSEAEQYTLDQPYLPPTTDT
jgi:hypothetical protein